MRPVTIEAHGDTDATMRPRGRATYAKWERLPRRLYLDSSTLQTLQRYGEFIWENVSPARGDRAYRMSGFLDDLDALRFIFQVNERAMFDIVVTRAAIEEVKGKRDGPYLRWALEVARHWQERMREYQGRAFDRGERPALDEERTGYLSRKDARLLREALVTQCDAFVTMEKRLPRNSSHLERTTGLRILRPPDFAELLLPWARLYQ